jgi:hypothetical protein
MEKNKMNENIYNPLILRKHTVFYYEMKNKRKSFLIDNKDFEKYMIIIEIKNSGESYRIKNRKLWKGKGLFESNSHLIKDHDELEKNKGLLGKVFVKKEGEEIGNFDDFDSFIKAIMPK